MSMEIYLTNLGKYVEGCLMGQWVKLPVPTDKLADILVRIGVNEEYEEFFFTDWECDVDAGFGEYESIEKVNELAERLERADEDVIDALIEAFGMSLEESLDKEDDAIFYRRMTMVEVAEELVSECYNLPEFALRYFDYEALARDLRFDGYESVTNGVIYLQ